jgi:hypothetical protein
MPRILDPQQFSAYRYELQRCRQLFMCAEDVTGAMDEQCWSVKGWEVSGP